MSVLKLHSEPVREAWLDAYGHLNEAYYLIPFSNAAWALQDHLGIGVDYFERTGGAIYTVETHLRYLKEVRAPASVELDTMIFDSDASGTALREPAVGPVRSTGAPAPLRP